MPKRLLLISPYFPPLKAIGSKRAINIVQGLTERGWQVDVLCSKAFFDSENTPYQFEVPEGVRINRGFVSNSLRPIVTFFKSDSKSTLSESIKYGLPKPDKPGASLTPFDQYIWDVPGAVKAGKKMIRQARPDVILVNADPWSGLLVGQKLSKWSGIPWVADLRDPWSVFQYKMELKPKWVQRIIRHYENQFFHSAAAVIFNTENALKEYQKTYPEPLWKKFTFIRNAYNPKLLKPHTEINTNKKVKPFVFGYFGSFRALVSPKNLLLGFHQFIGGNDLTPAEVLFEVTGEVTNEFHYWVEQLGLSGFIQINEAIPYMYSQETLRNWNVLLLVVDPRYALMVPAKLYDYLYAQKPILAISANSEVNEILQKTESGYSVSNDDLEGIAGLFNKLFNERIGTLHNHEKIKDYSMDRQVTRFEEVLNQVIRE